MQRITSLCTGLLFAVSAHCEDGRSLLADPAFAEGFGAAFIYGSEFTGGRRPAVGKVTAYRDIAPWQVHLIPEGPVQKVGVKTHPWDFQEGYHENNTNPFNEKVRELHTWSTPLRGTWVSASGGFPVVKDGQAAPLVVGHDPAEPVRTAARLLAADIEKISGLKPEVVADAPAGRPAIVFHDASKGPLPEGEAAMFLKGQREAFHICIKSEVIELFGSDARGTAYAGYELSERLGIDSLYLWTGFTPEKHNPLFATPTTFSSSTPAIRYRGFFHDDEDILPRPIHKKAGFPDPNGTVPPEWYERFFETAVRLRQNMVAPYTRTQRSVDIYRMANRYGLIITSHHYDVLMSNAWGFKRHGLAEKLGVKPEWDFHSNREGLITYWTDAVQKLKGLDVIWGIGMRADGDRAYKWPEGTTDADRKAFYADAHSVQMNIVRKIMGGEPEFAFTAWGELNRFRERGIIELPADTMLIWSDGVPAGKMKALPEPGQPGRHGVYYHLAILSGPTGTIQNAAVVSPELIAEQFKNIFAAGATEYLLVNVSELREFVREARMIAQISVQGKKLLDLPNPARAFRDWFSTEYFGGKAALYANATYDAYFDIVRDAKDLYAGNAACLEALDALESRLNGKESKKYKPEKVAADMRALLARCRPTLQSAQEAKAAMTPEAARYFSESRELPILMISQPAEAALAINEAFKAGTPLEIREAARKALPPLEKLTAALNAAERPPFEILWLKLIADAALGKRGDVHRILSEGRENTGFPRSVQHQHHT